MLLDKLKTIPQYLIPQHGLSCLMGQLAESRNPRLKNAFIRWFIKTYDVNMSEAVNEDPSSYACFNDFFIRHLKDEVRPQADSPIISPVDGTISQIGNVELGRIIQAKGRKYTVYELLAGNNFLSEHFINGRFATLYLSPKDYHRVHMPCDAKLKEMHYIPGKLFSVSPATTNAVTNLFARNERLIVIFETAFGLMAMVLVGATIVGTIGTSWQGDIERQKEPRDWIYPNPRLTKLEFSKGQEMGYFKMGSTVILLFEDKMQWLDTLKAGATIRYGEAIGINQQQTDSND